MNQNMGRLIRYILIINRLSGSRKYTPGHDLLSYLKLQMELRGYEVGITLRTIQRDIKAIQEMFEIEIKNRRGYGYYISDMDENSEIRYNDVLINFDLLTSISEDTQSSGYIIPEHHRPKGSDLLPSLIKAIKSRAYLTFTYTLYRKDNQETKRIVKPYFLKESLGFWYLIALDEKENVRSFGIDRISDLQVLDKYFKTDERIDPKNMFKHSYGIWDDPTIPVEEVELSFSPLDGSFLKVNPIHSSQQIISDTNKEFRIKIHIRITNDFIMALLSRSHSLEVIAPIHLRERISQIAKDCSKRNSSRKGRQ